MKQILLERHCHCNDCDADFMFIERFQPHENHDVTIVKEYYKDVPDDYVGGYAI